MRKTLKIAMLAISLLVFLCLLVLGLLFLIAKSDYIGDYNQYAERNFGIRPPFKIDRLMIVDVDPGFVIAKLSDAEMNCMRERDFKAEGYSGWEVNRQSCRIGYEHSYGIESDGESVVVNRKTLKNANDALNIYLDYRKKHLIFSYGITTDTGLEITAERARRILGISNPNWANTACQNALKQ